MSQSRKKTPVSGNTTARSEKQDKRLANRRLRRNTKQVLVVNGKGGPEFDPTLPLLREVSNVWSFDKDGRHWMRDPKPKDMRK